MEIVISVFAVAVAMSCLGTLVLAGLRDRQQAKKVPIPRTRNPY
jgi:hypothetical protein